MFFFFFLEGERSKFRNQHTTVKIVIFHTVILMFLERRQKQTMGLRNCIAAYRGADNSLTRPTSRAYAPARKLSTYL